MIQNEWDGGSKDYCPRFVNLFICVKLVIFVVGTVDCKSMRLCCCKNSKFSVYRQEYEELMNEVQEARRIKMLHQPSKVFSLEFYCSRPVLFFPPSSANVMICSNFIGMFINSIGYIHKPIV